MMNFRKHAIIVFFLWAFAPVAWYMIYSDKRFHGWFSVIISVNGIVITVLTILQLTNLLVEGAQGYRVLARVFLIGAAVVQIAYGHHLRKLRKKNRKIIEKKLYLIIAILSVNVLLGFALGLGGNW